MTNKDHAKLLQAFLAMQNPDHEPWAETGRKFDKVYHGDKVRYFIARMDVPKKGISQGDIFGAKSPITPNTNWYFGHLTNAVKWNWTENMPQNMSDDSVVRAGAYKTFIHWVKK